MVVFGIPMQYLTAFCLGVTLIFDVLTLRGLEAFTSLPIALGLVWHYQHGSLKAAAIALALPFALNLVTFVRRRIALFDLLNLGMIGVIMGWPFGLITAVTAKALMFAINKTWLVKLSAGDAAVTNTPFPIPLSSWQGLLLPITCSRPLPRLNGSSRLPTHNGMISKAFLSDFC